MKGAGCCGNEHQCSDDDAGLHHAQFFEKARIRARGCSFLSLHGDIIVAFGVRYT